MRRTEQHRQPDGDRGVERIARTQPSRNFTPVAERAFIVMLETGVREDELLRIEPKHCEFKNELLRLTAVAVKGKTRYSDENEVVREIPIQPAVAQALREQMAARDAGEVGAYYRRKQGPQLWNMSRTTSARRLREPSWPPARPTSLSTTPAERSARAARKPARSPCQVGWDTPTLAPR